MKKTILVTGAAGFLGREVVRQLAEAGQEIIPLRRLHRGSQKERS